MNALLKILKALICKKYPIWAYGLECTICEMSFGHPEEHLNHVLEQGTEEEHNGQIPKLIEE